jgi:hypothetical protein
LPIEEKCKILQRIGFKGMDLPTAQQIPVLKQYGLAPAMMTLQTGYELYGRPYPKRDSRHDRDADQIQH